MKEFLHNLIMGTLPGKYDITPLHLEYTGTDIFPCNRGEVLRYAGIPAAVIRKEGSGRIDGGYLDSGKNPEEGGDVQDDRKAELAKLLDTAAEMAEGQLTYRVSYCCAPVTWQEYEGETYPVLPFPQHSRALMRNLAGCSGVVIFAATIGSGVDRLIRRYERTQQALGVMLQAYGAERAEALCDTFNKEVSDSAAAFGLEARPRFSPGFADLPITVQPDILAITDAGRRLGITLNSSFLMAPSKSVTGIIGIRTRRSQSANDA